jgi:hypothetical protein
MRFIEVVRALRAGSLRWVERVPIFDRAVSGLISALRGQ